MTLRIGILGAAAITPRSLIAPAAEIDDIELVCIAARDRNRAKQFAAEHGVPIVHDSYEDVVTDPRIDAVYNPLQISGHKPWTIAALEAGKHVLCEKPLAMNQAEAQQIADTARRTGLVCIEGFHYWYHPVAHRMREIVQSGQLGRVLSADAHFQNTAPDTATQYRYQFELGGGATMDLGCYPLHMLRHIFQAEPEVVSARPEIVYDTIDVAMEIDLRFPGGIPAHARCRMSPGTPRSVEVNIVGEAGRMRVVDPLTPHRGHLIELELGFGRVVETLTLRPTFEFQLRAFAAQIAGGPAMPTDAEDGVISMRVIDNVYRAAGLPLRGEPK